MAATNTVMIRFTSTHRYNGYLLIFSYTGLLVINKRSTHLWYERIICGLFASLSPKLQERLLSAGGGRGNPMPHSRDARPLIRHKEHASLPPGAPLVAGTTLS